MLVTLGTRNSLGANASETYTYSPNSVQKVFIRINDAQSGEWFNSTVTVQIGSKVICNGATAWGLCGLTTLQSGFVSDGDDAMLVLDFGSHECTNMDNLYVTVTAPSALDYVDVSAIVDEPGLGIPVRLTEYSDNTFTSPNCLLAINYDSANQSIESDAYNMEVRTTLYSSAPSIISTASWFSANAVSNDYTDKFGLSCKNSVPLQTSFNYSGSAVTDRILTVEQDPVSRADVRQGKGSERIARAFAGK